MTPYRIRVTVLHELLPPRVRADDSCGSHCHSIAALRRTLHRSTHALAPCDGGPFPGYRARGCDGYLFPLNHLQYPRALPTQAETLTILLANEMLRKRISHRRCSELSMLIHLSVPFRQSVGAHNHQDIMYFINIAPHLTNDFPEPILMFCFTF